MTSSLCGKIRRFLPHLQPTRHSSVGDRVVQIYVSRRHFLSLSEPGPAVIFLTFGHVFLEKGGRYAGSESSVSRSISFVDFFMHLFLNRPRKSLYKQVSVRKVYTASLVLISISRGFFTLGALKQIPPGP
jgi:hypothetical protein